ncbi:MAG: hypothetical protein Q9169_005296 [Polycauliona sp. 2 TL-2023]
MMTTAAAQEDEAVKSITVRMASLDIKPKGLCDLPNELLQPIVSSFWNDPKALKSLRLVCCRFQNLVNPLLFKDLRFHRHAKDWSKLYDLLFNKEIVECVKSVEIAVSAASASEDSEWPLAWRPPPNTYNLNLDCLKLNDYRYLLVGEISLGLDTSCLKTLHIDTTTSLLHDQIANRPKPETCDGWKPKFGYNHFHGLCHLTITQDAFASPAIDVLYLLRNVAFGKLETVELNSVRSKEFFGFLLCCTRSNDETLRQVLISRLFPQPYSEIDLDIMVEQFKDDKRVVFDESCTIDQKLRRSMGNDWVLGYDLLPGRVWDPAPYPRWRQYYT